MIYRIIAKNAGIHYSEEPHFFGLDTDTETEGDQCITELRNKFMNIPGKKRVMASECLTVVLPLHFPIEIKKVPK